MIRRNSPYRALGWVGLLGLLLTAQPSWAAQKGMQQAQPPPRLTMEQAIFFGLTHHPKLFWYKHDVEKTKAGVKIAKAHFFPYITGGALYASANPGILSLPFANDYQFNPAMPVTFDKTGPLGTVSGVNSFDQSVFASIGGQQLLYDFGKYEHQTRFRKFLQKSATNTLLVRDAWVILQVREAYYHVLLDRKLIEAYQKNLEERAFAKELTYALYKADYKSKLDYDLAAVDYQKAKALLIDEQSDLKIQIARLNETMGLGKNSRKDYDLTDKNPTTLPPVPLSGLIREGLKARPELLSMLDQYSAHVEFTRSERATHYPYISAFGSYGYFGNIVSGQSYTPGIWSAGASLTVPIYTGGLIRGRIARARELSLEDKYHVSDWRIRIRLQVIRAFEKIQSDTADIVAYQKAVKEAELALVLANKKYQANLISIVALTLAEVYLVDTEADLAISQYHLAVDRAALKFASGLDYPEFVTRQGSVRAARVRLGGIDPEQGG